MPIGYNLDMAGLPAIRPEETDLDPKQRFRELIAEHMANGLRPADIARKFAPDDPKKRKLMRARIRNALYTDPAMAVAVSREAQVNMLVDLGPAVKAVGQRAKRGRTDAAKLLFEASGFHNPRVKHEHTGDIKIRLEMPRPTFDADATMADEDVVD